MAPTTPEPSSVDIRRALRWLLWLWAAFATHGSLYPWEFAWPASLPAAWAHMMHQDTWWTATGDVVGNVLLFAPIGALGWNLWREPRRGRWQRALVLMAAGVAFAFALQVAQIFIPARDAQLSDVVWNTLGLAIGMFGAASLPVARLARIGAAHVRIPLAMALWWICLQWWPLSPALNRRHIVRSLHLLWASPDWAALTAAQAALSLAVLGLLARALRPRLTIVVGCAVVAVMGKLMTAGQNVTVSHSVGLMAGTALAALSWRLSARRSAAFGAAIALLCFAVKTVRLLEMQLGDGLRAWLSPLLRGSMGSDSLTWGWIAYWLLATLILAQIARNAAESAPADGRVQPSRVIRKA
jgi:VanZ family protein